MKNEDARLVNQFLAGDEGAFTTLGKKYQKSVHALAWRKVDDFHTAEELTQDTFLKAYQKLGTLKNPNQFAGWLYVIANRLCIAWHRKQKPPKQINIIFSPNPRREIMILPFAARLTLICALILLPTSKMGLRRKAFISDPISPTNSHLTSL